MKFLLVLICLLPVLFGKPSPFFDLFDVHDYKLEKEHECAVHLHDACAMYLSPKLGSKVKPTFETCRVTDLMNCLEKEINATTECHRDGSVNHTRIRSVQFNFVNAKKCPCAEDLDALIEILTAQDDSYFNNVLVIGQGTDDGHEDWHESILSDEDADGLGHFDSFLDHEDTWAEDKNATSPQTEEEDDENNTKKLFGTGDKVDKEKTSAVSKGEEDLTTDIRDGNAPRNSTDDDFDKHIDNSFLSYLETILSPDSWNDWDEDNEDDTEKDGMVNHKEVSPDKGIDMHGDNEDSRVEGYEEGIGMGKNSSDHLPKITENGDSDTFGEWFGHETHGDETHGDDTHGDDTYGYGGYYTDSGTNTDSHADDEPTHPDDSMAGGWEDVAPEYDAYDYHK